MILTQRVVQTDLKDLLEADCIDIDKIKQFVQKEPIAGEFKPLCWKILLDIKSPYRATSRYVDQANENIYQCLQSTLKACQLIHDHTPIAQQFLSMYLLDSQLVKLPIIPSKEYESFSSIAKFICSFLDPYNEQRLNLLTECWLMTCKIYDKFTKLTQRIALLRYHVGNVAQKELQIDAKLLLHLNTHNVFASLPENWLKYGFLLIDDDISLLMIWEKFLAGSEYIFVYLTIHILQYCRLKLLSLHSAQEILQYLADLKIEDQTNCEPIVIATIASWKKANNSLLEFPAMKS